MKWSVVYKRAIQEDGSLLFPEKLSREFLDQARRTMGSFLFANQYQNECIPDDEKSFRPEWRRYYSTVPKITYRFAFVDPAIGQKDHHDFTGICVIDVDTEGTWYLRVANRYRLTPTQIVSKIFQVQEEWGCMAIGVEVVAYQEALIYLLDQEMRKRDKILPIKGITRKAISKQTRILGLAPRFEWGRILIAQGLIDFEDEYSTFPRGSHDDILDALASIEELAYTPDKEKAKPIEKPHSPHDPNYERWVIQNYATRQQRNEDE